MLAKTAWGGRGCLSGPGRRAPRGPASEQGCAGTVQAGAPRAVGDSVVFLVCVEEGAHFEKVQEEVPGASAVTLGEGLSVLTLYL